MRNKNINIVYWGVKFFLYIYLFWNEFDDVGSVWKGRVDNLLGIWMELDVVGNLEI